MGAQRAAWTAAFSAEAAAAGGREHAAALLDLVKAFEMIPHWALAKAAKQCGYSLKVLRLSVAAYRIARSIGIDGTYSKEITATRGITAGSGFATSELRLLLMELISAIRTSWPVALKLYVDDMTKTASGTRDAATAAVAAATDFAVERFRSLGLEVSTKKSIAVASSLKTLRALAFRTRTRALKPARSTKLLGTAFAAGTRRSTRVLKARIKAVKQRTSRVQALRRQGLSSIDYVRSAGIPAMLYQSEIMGLSNSTLAQATRTAAALVAPPTAGKNPTLVMHATALHTDAADPRLIANVAPFKTWATAWWEGWASDLQLMTEYQNALQRLGRTSQICWNKVRGPAAALVATGSRIGWTSEDGRRFVDDIGALWDMALDSPRAIADAVMRSAKRHNFDQALAELPTARPHELDVRHRSAACGRAVATGKRTCIYIDTYASIRKLHRGGKKVAKLFPHWTRECAGFLASATCGGQWPQTRKSKLPGFSGDTLCQLCHEAIGTLEHRHHCRATCPAAGWPRPEPQVEQFVRSISDNRRDALRNRAVLAVSIPIAEPQVETGGWHWLSDPPNDQDDGLIWVIDGSRRYNTDWSLSTTGCGVAVLNQAMELVAYAHATPPHWVKTARAAETWALLLTLRLNPTPPQVRTDCMGVMMAAKRGYAAATAPSRPLARIWREIGELLNNEFDELATKIVWIPAHTSADSIDSCKRSDGRQLSVQEWRANQLADALAKRGAPKSQMRNDAERRINMAHRALLHSAAQLGVVTRAANAHKELVVNSSGEQHWITRRDSSAAPRRASTKPASTMPQAAGGNEAPDKQIGSLLKQLQADALPGDLTEPTLAQRRSSSRTAARKQTAALEKDMLQRLLSDQAARCQPPTITAAERLAALKARLATRWACTAEPPRVEAGQPAAAPSERG